MNPPEREPRPNDAATDGAADARTGGDDDERVDAHRMRLIARIAPGVAHEIGNPVAAIVAFGELMRNDPRLPDDMRRDAGLLVEAAEQTRSLIAGFLDLVRERPPERHPTRIAALVDSVVALSAYRVSSARTRIAVDIAEELPRVGVDRPRMQQVLLALVDASAATDRRIGIRATADATRARVVIEIEPAAPLPDAAVVAGIVHAHGGRLRIGNVAFEIELPVAASAAAPASRPAELAPRPATASASTVLVVDDDVAMRTLLGRALGRAGYEVVLAASPAEASAIAVNDGARIGAVLCDHQLGAGSGTDACTALLATHPDLRGHVALMSADVDDAALRAYADANGILLLAKPFDISTVVDFVSRLSA